jgi:hypothetical protein
MPTFWMMAVALPGSPLISSSIILSARSTDSSRPVTLMMRLCSGAIVWSTMMCAPEAVCSDLIVSPLRPMMRPTMPGAHSVDLVTSPTLGPDSASSAAWICALA